MSTKTDRPASLAGAPCSAGAGEPYLPAPGQHIDLRATCPDCGHTSADFGRFRKAEPHEQGDADGEIYECGYCGGLLIVDPPNE